MVQFHDRVWGPDVSSWQGDVDWRAVKADGASFGITKITEGTNYVNPYAAAEWAEMGQMGLVRVQYHYARPAKLSATEEAAFFLTNRLPLAVGDIVALDLEVDSRDGLFTNGAYWASSWIDTVKNALGFTPMLYCNGGILRDPNQGFIAHEKMGQEVGLWLAAWGEVLPSAVPPWDTVALWQFTNSGRVPGIDGFVDLNIFNGTLEQMRKYGMPAPAGNGGDMGGNPDTADLHTKLKDIGDRIDKCQFDLSELRHDAWALADRFKDKEA